MPQPFTPDRPAITYTHQEFQVSINEHPLAKLLPKPTAGAAIHEVHDFRPFVAREDHPTTLEEYLLQDISILSLHIVSFNDATLVALGFHHSLMDVMGQKAVIEAWSQVLAGRESEVPPVLGAREDVLDTVLAESEKTPKEEFILKDTVLRGWRWALILINFLWDNYRYGATETHTIFLPRHTMEQLQSEAQQDIARSQRSDGEYDEKAPYISDNDIIAAWASRLILGSLPQGRSLVMWHISNARFRLPAIKRAAGVYIQNMILGAFFVVSPDLATRSLGRVALANRRALAPQLTEPQTLALLRYMRPGFETSNIICANTNSIPVMFTNWTRAEIYHASNFGPAVIRAGETGPSRKNAPGTIVFHCGQPLRKGGAGISMIGVGGKDYDGNYWMDLTVYSRVWGKVRQEIDRLAQI